MNTSGRISYGNLGGGLGNGCGPTLMTYVLLIGFMLIGFCSCRTISDKESYTEQHRIDLMMAKIDSVINKSQTIVQDTSWRETFIQKLESIKERNDTSHTIVVDSTGKVIKETITIIREREVSSESDRLEREGMKHSIEKMDSTISVQNEQISRLETMLKEKTKETVIEKKKPWYKELWDNVRFILIGLVIGIVIMFTKKIWKRHLP